MPLRDPLLIALQRCVGSRGQGNSMRTVMSFCAPIYRL